MSHNLCIEAGRARMFYHGDPPWHGLGQRLEGPATAAEAIQAAGLDWEVEKIPVFIQPGPKPLRVPNRFAIVRSDLLASGQEPKALGIVGDEYQPMQNRDAFAFFDDLVGGPDQAIYHTAGALGDGERVWILAKLPGEILVAKDDLAEKYLLLSSSHDGESAIQLKFTPIRVVCQNTLTLALSGGPKVTIAHRAGMHERMRWAAEAMGIITRRFDALGEQFQALARIRLDQQQAELYFESVFPIQPEQVDKPGYAWVLNKMRLGRKAGIVLFDTGAGAELPESRHTLWAAFNAVTEYADHYSRHITPDPAARDKHLDSIWFGDGFRLKARALRKALELARSGA